MKNHKIPFSIKLLYWLTNIVFVLMILVCALVLLMNVLLYTNVFGEDVQMHAQLPVNVDLLETGNLHLNRQNIQVKLVDASAQIHFVDTPEFISRRIGVIVLVVTILILAVVRTFQLFMKNVYKGEVFILRNILLIKNLAYGLFAIWLFTIIYMHLFYYIVAKNLNFENVKIQDDVQSYSGVLIVSLFVWILAHIFEVGLRLKEDKDLTI